MKIDIGVTELRDLMKEPEKTTSVEEQYQRCDICGAPLKGEWYESTWFAVFPPHEDIKYMSLSCPGCGYTNVKR